MFSRLSTVKAKLTALVGLSIVVMLAALPILSWLLHRQMLDEVDERVNGAKKSFIAELDDDLSDLTLASRVLGQDEGTRHAIAKHDGPRARHLAELFLAVYPELDVLIFDVNGLVAQAGVDAPPEHPEVLGAELGGPPKAFRGVLAHGCEASASAPPAMVLSVPITAPHEDNGAAQGLAVVCMPLGDSYLQNTATKLGMELEFARGDARFARSSGCPAGGLTRARAPSAAANVMRLAGRSWALATFDVPELTVTSGPPVSVISALDVTDVHEIIVRNLLLALLVLAIAGAASVVLGLRLAGVMSHALGRVNIALKKLGEQEYVHVTGVKTGDELEDLAAGFNTMVDGLKERDQLKTTMGKYMTASVIEHLMSGKVQLGGETLPVTILFSDIRSFTTISEKMNAQELVGLLNEYFTEMVGVVMDNGGVVDKYIGDAIMAVFGAPVPKKDDAIHAVLAAVRMRVALKKLNAKLVARGVAALRSGIGIHTGEVVAGNIGSERRMEYTVIGDAVNLASRLESNTKDLGVNVLISEDTWKLVKDAVVARPVKEITVKGRKQPVMTYEVVGIVGEPELERDL
jgi:adenylate cyclase